LQTDARPVIELEEDEVRGRRRFFGARESEEEDEAGEGGVLAGRIDMQSD